MTLEHCTNTTFDGNEGFAESRLWKHGHFRLPILPARIRELLPDNPFNVGPVEEGVSGTDKISFLGLETAEGKIFSGTIDEITDVLQETAQIETHISPRVRIVGSRHPFTGEIVSYHQAVHNTFHEIPLESGQPVNL